MRYLFLSLLISIFFKLGAQDNFKLTVSKSGSTNELIVKGTLENRYTVHAKGHFLVIELNIERVSDEAPRRLKAEDVKLKFNGAEIACTGTIESSSQLFENVFHGVSLYSPKRDEVMVFEIPESFKEGELIFAGQSVPVKSPGEWQQSLPLPEIKVLSIETKKMLVQNNSSFGPEKKYSKEIRTEGAFVIVEIELGFKIDAQPRPSDFCLIDKNGLGITSIGDMKEDAFRYNMNTGAMRLSKNRKETMTIVFPIGNLTEKSLKSDYSLSYRGLVKVSLFK